MSWLELSLPLSAEQQPRVEAALEDLGALSITLADANADAIDEQAIFEPGPDETPVWPSVALSALFAADTDCSGLVHALTELVPELAPEKIVFREIADQEWTRAWMDQFRPMCFGIRLWIYPSNIDPPADANEIVIVRLDPGLAFGTGTHPTTALCLQWLDATDLAGKTLIDYGCGSGVLAIAALKLGANRVVGVDNDPQALTASRVNAERNDVSEKMELFLSEHFSIMSADILIANILAGPLDALAPHFAQCLQSGASLVLSGILAGQEQVLLTRYSEWFERLEISMYDGWVRIAGRRK